MRESCRIAILFVLPLIWVASANAFVEVTNLADDDIRVSFLGDGCRLFDNDHYSYAACDKRDVSVNDTAFFPQIGSGHTQSREQAAIVPRIIFHWFGFSYACKIRRHFIKHFCSQHCEFLFPNGCEGTSFADDVSPAFKPGTLLLLHTVTLSAQRSYRLEVLSDYGYFPQPYVECNVVENRMEPKSMQPCRELHEP